MPSGLVARHRTLHHAKSHGGDVQHDADGRDPEVGGDQLGRECISVLPFLCTRDQGNFIAPIDTISPAQGTGMHVADGQSV